MSLREDLRAIEVSETRILLLYATRAEGENIMRWAKEAGLTSKSYIWVAAQSVIGERKDASTDFPAGMLGTYIQDQADMVSSNFNKYLCTKVSRPQ